LYYAACGSLFSERIKVMLDKPDNEPLTPALTVVLRVADPRPPLPSFHHKPEDARILRNAAGGLVYAGPTGIGWYLTGTPAELYAVARAATPNLDNTPSGPSLLETLLTFAAGNAPVRLDDIKAIPVQPAPDDIAAKIDAAFSEVVPDLDIGAIIDMDCLDARGEDGVACQLFLENKLLLAPHVLRSISTAIDKYRSRLPPLAHRLSPIFMDATAELALNLPADPSPTDHATLAKEMYYRYADIDAFLTKNQRVGVFTGVAFFVPLTLAVSHTAMQRAWQRQSDRAALNRACMGAAHDYTLGGLLANGQPPPRYIRFPSIQLITPAAISLLLAVLSRTLGTDITEHTFSAVVQAAPRDLAQLWGLEVTSRFRESASHYTHAALLRKHTDEQERLARAIRAAIGAKPADDALLQAVARKRSRLTNYRTL
jgi:hypothetical protein